MKALLTPQQVADLLQISVKTVYKRKRHRGAVYPAGLRYWRFKREEVYAAMENKRRLEIPVSMGGIRYSRQGFKTMAEARAAMERHRAELKRPPSTATDTAFSDLANLYLDWAQRRFEKTLKTTFSFKKFVFRNFLHTVGDLDVSQITVSLI